MHDLKATWIAKAVQGTLDWGSEFNISRLRQWLEQHEGKLMRLTPVKEYRSGQQNKLYWLYLQIIAHETGNEVEEMHEFFKRKLLPIKKISIRGKKVNHEFERETSTTELSKGQFIDYMMKIEQMTDIPIPNPKDLEGFIPN